MTSTTTSRPSPSTEPAKPLDNALRVSNARFKTMFIQAPEGIAVVDSHTGKLYEVNSKFAEIIGRTIAETITLDWMSMTHPEDRQVGLDNIARMNAGEIPGFSMDKRFIRPDGSVVWISMTVAALTVEPGIVPCHLCMIEDITERKAADMALSKEAADLAVANKELTVFNSFAVMREQRMMELKKQVDDLHVRLGEPPEYTVRLDATDTTK